MPARSGLDAPKVIAVVVLVGLFIGLGISTVYRAAYSPKHRTDFTVYTAAGQAVVEGTPLYDAKNERGWYYMYLPVFAIFMVPLAPLPVALSSGIWYGLSVALLLHSAWLSARLAKEAMPRARLDVFWLSVVILGLTAWTWLSGMARGQASVLIVWLTLLAADGLLRRRPWTCGLALAAATVIKVFPGLLGLYLLLRRRWTEVLTSAAGMMLFVVILPSLVFGPTGNALLLKQWTTQVIGQVGQSTTEEDERYDQMSDPRIGRNQSLTAVAIRWVAPHEEAGDTDRREWAARLAGRVLGIVSLGLVAAACLRRRGEREDEVLRFRQELLDVCLILVLSLMISPVSWSHSFLLMLMPLAVLVAAATDAARFGHGWNRLLTVLAVFTVGNLLGATIDEFKEGGVLLIVTVVVGVVLWRLRWNGPPQPEPLESPPAAQPA